MAQIRVSRSGTVTTARILQAPDGLIARAVLDAAYSSRFRLPVQEPHIAAGIGKLYFYFRVRDGRPAVLLPTEAAATHRGALQW